jgi:hypothetical protein
VTVDKQLQEYDANVGFRCGGITVNIDDMVRSIDFDCVAHDRPRVFLALQSTFMFASFMTFPGQCNSRFAAAHESAFGTKRTWPDVRPMSAFGGKADITV